MFDFLRKAVGPIMIIVLIAFVCTIIFSWGGGGFNQGPSDTIGIIDGENIAYKEYEQYYSNLIRQEQEKTEQELTRDQLKRFRDQAWSQLVADRLMNNIIEEKQIKVTDKELFDYLRLYPPEELQAAPQFITDGQFDYQKYVNAMVSPENAPFWKQVEAYVMGDLKKFKLQENVLSTIRVTPAEVMETFLAEKELAKIGYLQLLNDAIQPIIPEPTDDELKAYYDSHKEEYLQDKKAAADMVLFSKDANEQDWERLYYEIKDIYDSAIAGSDFAELAQDYSEDGSAPGGGDLGFFEQGRMVGAFDSATFAMNIGDICPPIRTKFGYHVIQLVDVKTEEGVEKRKASHILLKIKASEDTKSQAYNNAVDLSDFAKEDGFSEKWEE